MRLIALAAETDHVSCRYRIAGPAAGLARAGYSVRVARVPRRWWSWLPLLPRLAAADAVVVQRWLLHPAALRLVRGAARRLVFDFDDAVYQHDSYDPRGPRSERLMTRFRETVMLTDAVFAGNDHLARQAGRWATGRVLVVPTGVDPSRYPPAEHRDRSGTGLVWIGSSSTLQGLEKARSLLEAVGSGVPGVRLKVICDRSLGLTHLPVEFTPWSEETEAASIAAAGIGISWIPDDDWSRGKCGLKVLQYMAAGLPVIANPVGVHPAMVRHGVTGFLASTPGEWVEAVRVLAVSPELRRRMGRAGRERVERDYSVARVGELWLEGLASGKGRSAA